MASSYGGNAGGAQQRRGASRSQSLFYRDMNLVEKGFRAPPQSSSSATVFPGTHQGSSPGASLWRDNVGGGGSADPPPPPCFTLEDRIDRPPSESLLSPPVSGEFRSPETPAVRFSDGKSPLKTPQSGASSIGRSGGLFGDPSAQFQSPAASSSPWWSASTTVRDWQTSDGERDNAFVHHHFNQHEPQHLLTLPAPRQIVRPDVQRTSTSVDNGEEGDEWITVYGFQGEDTNAVLREFEKCGPIVRHVPGPSNSNWLHIQYQSRQDAQKALRKNGMQLYGALIIGVKPVDSFQRHALMDKAQKSIGFTLPSKAAGPAAASQASARPYYLQASGGDSAAARPLATIASPTKSIMSKVVDLVFGF